MFPRKFPLPCHPGASLQRCNRSTWGPICTASCMVGLVTHVTVLYGLIGLLPGVQLYLCFKTIQTFLTHKRTRRKSDIAYAAFSIVMLILVTIWMALVGIQFGQEMFQLDDQTWDVPSEPIADMVMKDVVMTVPIIMQVMTDGLMVRPGR